MTLPLVRRRRFPSSLINPVHELSAALLAMDEEDLRPRWPNPRYAGDPVAFHREVLGIEPWDKQREVLESVRDNPLTSVKSGHRIGKSTIAGGGALWFYSSFEEARVVCTAPTIRQVEGILWREIKKLFARAGRCVSCKRDDPNGPKPCAHSAVLAGALGAKPSTGLVNEDAFCEIRGYTAKDVEAITGTAGPNLFFILDEASGIADVIYEGLEGNRAGWSEDPGVMVRMLLLGNPTKTTGEFYDSHEHPKKKSVYHRITVSSRETPNAQARRVIIPGLATDVWIAQMEAKYGAESAFVRVRVDGEFPVGEDGKAFPISLITASEERWEDTEAEGPLYIGLDPAGETGTGDDTAMTGRRGLKQLLMRVWLGLSEEAVAVHLLDMIVELRMSARERAIVVMDAEGPVGLKVYSHLAVLAARRDAIFELHRVRASDNAVRDSLTFDRVRDELAHCTSMWLRSGGAILQDERLEEELHILEWERVHGKSKITPKKKIRKELKRSPDRYDSLALAVWEPVAASGRTGHNDADDDDADDLDDVDDIRNPYGHRGGIDPFGHRR